MAIRKLCRNVLTTTAATQYTSTQATTQIVAATLTNKTAGAVTATIYVANAGGSSADANALIVEAVSVPANDVIGIPELVGHVLDPNELLIALASANTSLVLFVSGDVKN